MNKKSRESVKNIITVLETVSHGVENLKDREDDSMSNLEGTSLEETEMYESIEKSSEYLGDALSDIESAIDNLKDAISK